MFYSLSFSECVYVCVIFMINLPLLPCQLFHPNLGVWKVMSLIFKVRVCRLIYFKKQKTKSKSWWMLPVQFQVCEIVILSHVQIIHNRFQLYTVILILLPPTLRDCMYFFIERVGLLKKKKLINSFTIFIFLEYSTKPPDWASHHLQLA